MSLELEEGTRPAVAQEVPVPALETPALCLTSSEAASTHAQLEQTEAEWPPRSILAQAYVPLGSVINLVGKRARPGKAAPYSETQAHYL